MGKNLEEAIMKALVTYHSESSNTEKLANAIYEALTGVDSEIEKINAENTYEDYDVIFVGFPVHSSSVPADVENCIKRIPEGKMIALFATHGSLRGGPLAISAFHYAITLAPKAIIIGTFGCRGEVKASLLDKLITNPEYKFWALEAQSAEGHPDDADLQDAIEFAKSMLFKAKYA
jgi:flavodoxin